MIKQMIELLQLVNGNTETIRIAQGKNYLPDNLTDIKKQIKKEASWVRKG